MSEAFHIIFTQTVQNLAGAFAVGFFGSAAYITALYFRFVGETNENRKILMRPFCRPSYFSDGGPIHLARSIWYCFIGAIIAMIFQFDVPNFVGIQNFILGVTWPAIVSQFLSGRMAAPSNAEISENISGVSRPVTNVKEFRRIKSLIKGRIP